MAQRVAQFRNRRYNSYVPAAQYAADLVHSAPYRVDYGTPSLAVAAAILNAQSIATATSTTTFVADTIADTFGRNLQIVASAASTSVITINGRDYLGQPVRETITANGTTPVVGVKAFKWIDSISWTATAATTINVGTGARFGLPYRASTVTQEQVDGANAAVGTFTAGVLTDPQTATTADPRGLYTPTTTPDGVKRIFAVIMPYPILNAAGNGGLYGIAHFGG